MSTHTQLPPGSPRKITVPDIKAHKRAAGALPVVALTAYTALSAKLLDEHVDLILVGDSLGMVLYGFDNTLSVTLEMMIAHGKAVMRGASRPCVIVDMPFGSYQESPQVAFRNAARIMKEVGCDGVKLEGGAEMAQTITYLVKRGIPVLAHIGLMPQSVHIAGGFRSRGREAGEAEAILQDGIAIAEAGAFAVVVEGTVEALGRQITETINIPTIGIGASPACDGQILVMEDIAGLFTDFKPRFVKRYVELGKGIGEAAKAYAEDVRAGRFPTLEHCFGVKKSNDDD